jgi:hypothetical protein
VWGRCGAGVGQGRGRKRSRTFLSLGLDVQLQETGQGAGEAGIVVEGHLGVHVVLAPVVEAIGLVGPRDQGSVEHLGVRAVPVELGPSAGHRLIRARGGGVVGLSRGVVAPTDHVTPACQTNLSLVSYPPSRR